MDLSYSNPSTLQSKALGFQPDGGSTGNALNLWNYRRIINKDNFKPGTYEGDITIVNWPQNDYLIGNIIDVSEKEFKKHIENAKQLSLSLFYWLQTEVPRPDGGKGWPGLRLRGDIFGTEDGLAKYPYVRESRRIKAIFTILEEHVGAANRALITGVKSPVIGPLIFMIVSAQAIIILTCIQPVVVTIISILTHSLSRFRLVRFYQFAWKIYCQPIKT